MLPPILLLHKLLQWRPQLNYNSCSRNCISCTRILVIVGLLSLVAAPRWASRTMPFRWKGLQWRKRGLRCCCFFFLSDSLTFILASRRTTWSTLRHSEVPKLVMLSSELEKWHSCLQAHGYSPRIQGRLPRLRHIRPGFKPSKVTWRFSTIHFFHPSPQLSSR